MELNEEVTSTFTRTNHSWAVCCGVKLGIRRVAYLKGGPDRRFLASSFLYRHVLTPSLEFGVAKNPAEGVAQQAALGPLDPNLLIAGTARQWWSSSVITETDIHI